MFHSCVEMEFVKYFLSKAWIKICVECEDIKVRPNSSGMHVIFPYKLKSANTDSHADTLFQVSKYARRA